MRTNFEPKTINRLALIIMIDFFHPEIPRSLVIVTKSAVILGETCAPNSSQFLSCATIGRSLLNLANNEAQISSRNFLSFRLGRAAESDNKVRREKKR